jgi:hypothetical protein
MAARSKQFCPGGPPTNALPLAHLWSTDEARLHEEWTVSLSHEALEMIADPECNLVARGPHPSKRGQYVFHYYEMCDAVQNDTYAIDGVDVSNFVLPLYFTGQDEPGGRNDFLSTTHRDKKTKKARTIRSFGINPGGYIAFFNPDSGEDEMATLEGDRRAQRRLKLKRSYGGGRRSVRHQRFSETAQGTLVAGAVVVQTLQSPTFVPVPEGVSIVRPENA